MTEERPSHIPIHLVRGEGITVRLLEEYDNLYVDLSGAGHFGLLSDRQFAREFLVRFQAKALFGTDKFKRDLRGLLLSFGLPPATMRRIMGGNALKLIGD